MTNALSFGQQARIYAKGRPQYPAALYDWIALNSPGQNMVWDVGTGSGQAAISLADRFEQVYATDISQDQIDAAPKRANITYDVAPAQSSGLEENSADAVTVATAVHWFADTAFWNEVGRVATTKALFCAWTYKLMTCGPDIHQDFLDPLYALIDPYWARGNRICMEGYSRENLNCPFIAIETPEFDAGGVWSAEQIADFALSWSAHLRAREDGKADILENLRQSFLAKYKDQEIAVSLPMSLLAAHIN